MTHDLTFTSAEQAQHLVPTLPEAGAILFHGTDWTAMARSSPEVIHGRGPVRGLPDGVYVSNLPYDALTGVDCADRIIVKPEKWWRIGVDDVMREWAIWHDLATREGRESAVDPLSQLFERNTSLLGDLCEHAPARLQVNRLLANASSAAATLRNRIASRHQFAETSFQANLVGVLGRSGIDWRASGAPGKLTLRLRRPRMSHARAVFSAEEPHGTSWDSADIGGRKTPAQILDTLLSSPEYAHTMVAVQIPARDYCGDQDLPLVSGYIEAQSFSDRRLYLSLSELEWLVPICEMTVLSVDRPTSLHGSTSHRLLEDITTGLAPGGLDTMTWSAGILAEMIASASLQVTRKAEDGERIRSMQSAWHMAMDRGQMSPHLPDLVKAGATSVRGYLSNLVVTCPDADTAHEITLAGWRRGLVPDLVNDAQAGLGQSLQTESFPGSENERLHALTMIALDRQVAWDIDAILDMPERTRDRGLIALRDRLSRATTPKY